jgi:CubicO group peptidase (beta-lactamase class C family)
VVLLAFCAFVFRYALRAVDRVRFALKQLIVLVLAVVAVAAHAQPVTVAEYRQHLQQGVDAGAYQQIAAGWLDGAERQIWFFGHDAKPEAASTFEIGAATEIFTGLLLAQAAYESKVRLPTSVRELLQKDFPLADPALGAITLQELATHRAGLPTLPPNLLPANIEDPYADYSAQNLYALLANYHRPEIHGSAYSALDAGLLGELLGRCYQKSYADLLDEKILKPLHMEHTGFDDDAGLLIGHTREDVAPHWHFGALGGAAGLRSSVGDLLTFLQQNLRPADSPLRAALLLARQAQGDGLQSAGLGWNIVEVTDGEQPWPLVWRASRTAGFATFLGFRTDRQQALVLLGNGDADLSVLGLAWLRQQAPPPLHAPLPPAPKVIAWDDYPGLYKLDGGGEFIVRSDARGVSAQLRGQPAEALRGVEEDAFASEALALAFTRDNHKVTGAILNMGGLHVQARRLSEHAPGVTRTPIGAPVASDLAGDYLLDGATLVRIRSGERTLALQMTARAPLRLQAFAPDRYADANGSCEVTFQRSSKGAVTGVILSLAGIDRTAPRVVWTAPAVK